MTATMANYRHPIAVGRAVTDQPQRFGLPGASGIAHRRLLSAILDVHAYML